MIVGSSDKGHIGSRQAGLYHTVGAQSLACAQSIACGHIGDNICQKNKIIEKLCLHKIRRGNSAADS
jgi:hypothetical protein